MKYKSLAVVGAVIVIGLLAFLASGQFSNTKDATIGTVLSENGFTEFRPASRHVPPGTLVHVASSQPLSLGVICGPTTSLGINLTDIPTSPTIATQVRAALDRDFQIDAGLMETLKGVGTLSDVTEINLQLSNVRVLEIPDTMVFEGLSNRSDACSDALRFRIDAGQSVTMVKSAIVADVTYTATLQTDGSANVSADLEDTLASTLSSKVTSKDSDKIELTGTDLIWGIRDDLVLAQAGLGLPSTGSSNGNRSILPTDTPVNVVEISEQARAEVPAGFEVVRYNVGPMRQVGKMDCWATVYTMLTSWRDGTDYTVKDAVVQLGPEYLEYWRKNTGLPGGKEQEFVATAGMTALPPAAYQLSGYVRFLEEHGPLWIITGDGISSHAKLLVGIFGPEFEEELPAYENAIFEFIDPADGTYHYERALDFMEEFEREARMIVDSNLDDIDLRWQILHL